MTARVRLRAALFLVAALGLTACSRDASPPPAPTREVAPRPNAAPPAAMPPTTPPIAEAVPQPAPLDLALPIPVQRPRSCEVEMIGRLELPKGAPTGDANYLFATVGDCLAPDPKVLGWGRNTNGRFFVEVFVPWGSDVSLCAVSIAPPGQPSTLYGKAPGRMHAEKSGEIEFKNLVIPLRPGPPHFFPRPPGR